MTKITHENWAAIQEENYKQNKAAEKTRENFHKQPPPLQGTKLYTIPELEILYDEYFKTLPDDDPDEYWASSQSLACIAGGYQFLQWLAEKEAHA